MKVIDLLNKIANGEKAPKKIKVNNMFVYEYEDGIDYKTKDGTYLFSSYIEITKEDLNMEIEIIEDTPKVQVEMTQEEYNKYLDSKLDTQKEDAPKKIKKLDICSNAPMSYLGKKINEIIDRLNGE